VEQRIADRMIAEAVYAAGGNRWRAVRETAAALAELPVTARSLLARLQAEILAAWQRGWQPAELVRVVRRQSTPRHAAIVVDAVSAQMRGYAAAAVDERWSAQLADLGAAVRWEADDRLLQWWAAREELTEPQIVEIVIATLMHLQRLPRLPFTGPLPGPARPGPAPRAAGPTDRRMLDRVRALLAKAESTTFPEEAEAYTAKAQELMARHSIDYALLVSRSGARDEPAVRRIAVDNPYEAPKTLLLQAVASANRCKSVWAKDYGFATVMGFPTDLDSVELLFTSLLVQGVRAMTQTGPRQDRYGRNNTRSFRQSFLTAYAQRIGERLHLATETVVAEAATGGEPDLLPVLKARADEVQARFAELFPGIRTRTISVSNREGWAEGRAAADRADLHGRASVRS
jgi:Protein of unknown function (DUF2786)